MARIKEFSKIGTVTHYYPKIQVAVIILTEELKIGDEVRFIRGGEDLFDQKITSMQKEHLQVEIGKSGETIAIQIEGKVKDRTEVFLIT